ncbi:MAG: YkgJ family cysteine cluster protein [Cryomorphaceae bacterium]|nr:YkgJ family cysteine cluster protein [Cryomorphaceae bacterium]
MKSSGPAEFLKRLKRQPPRDLDEVVHELHNRVFARTNCLDCANCCKTTGPLWTERDKERVAKRLRMKSAELEARYLRLDEDGDWVLRQLPCPFLEADNACSIYEDRPKACREYPHTDRVKQAQILELTAKNALICPAVGEIVARMEARYAEKSGAAKTPKPRPTGRR